MRAEVAVLGLHPPTMDGIHYATAKELPADCPTVRRMRVQDLQHSPAAVWTGTLLRMRAIIGGEALL